MITRFHVRFAKNCVYHMKSSFPGQCWSSSEDSRVASNRRRLQHRRCRNFGSRVDEFSAVLRLDDLRTRWIQPDSLGINNHYDDFFKVRQCCCEVPSCVALPGCDGLCAASRAVGTRMIASHGVHL